jgi:hypothetical protein
MAVKQKKDKMLFIRCTVEEREQLHKVAKEKGTTISGLLMSFIKDGKK